MKTKLSFKSDGYKKSRGGESHWLLLNCAKCKNPILMYQKDGIGTLKRLYLDRITEPKDFVKDKNLICKKCQATLGISMIYQKEKRPAYRLMLGMVEKKIVKGDEVLEINL